MGISFNTDEIFEMAEEIERNGAKFYRKAAQSASDAGTKKILLDLAAMEDGHLKLFSAMRKQLSAQQKEQKSFDPDNQAAQYLKTMADAHGCEGKKSPTENLTGKESIKEIFEIALNAEKESVVFYFGIRSFVSQKADRDRVETVINEEIGHIAVLNEKLTGLKK